MEKPKFGKPETGGFGENGKPDYLEIRHASKALCLDALESFPLDIGDWTAAFSASAGEQMTTAYGSILPGTKFSWVSSYRSGKLVPADTQFDFWRPMGREEGRNNREAFVRGGRFAVHEFKAEGDDTYDEFKTIFMEAFAERGYDLDSASVSTPQDSITLRVYRSGNIELSMAMILEETDRRSDFLEADEAAVREWFERLDKRNKQEQPAI